MGDAIYHRTRLGDSLLHVLQKFCIAGELEGAEARRIIADFNEIMAEELRSPDNSGPPATKLKGNVTRFNFVNMPRNSANATWTGQGGPTWFINISDASFTIRGNTTSLKGVTQLGIRESIKGKAPAPAQGGRTGSTGAGSSGGHRRSRDMELDPGDVGERKGRIGARLRRPMTKEQERLKRKREEDGAKSDKGLHQYVGGVARKGDGGTDQRKRQRFGELSNERVTKSDDSASVGNTDELDDDLDDLEKELDEMEDGDCDSIEAGISPIGDRKGQEVSSSSEADEEDDPNGAESDDSVGAATLEIERFLQSFEGGDDTGDAQTVREHSGVIAVGTEDSEAETVAKSERVGANRKTLKDYDDSTPQKGTMPPVHVETNAPEATDDRRYLGDEAGEGSDALGRGEDHLSGDERQGPPHGKPCPGGRGSEGGASPVASPKHQSASGDWSQKEEKTDEIHEDVDSDLERDFDGMLNEGDGSSNHELEPESDQRKSDGGELVEKRGSGAASMLFDEDLEDVSSYSDEESGNEDAIEDIEGFLAQI